MTVAEILFENNNQTIIAEQTDKSETSGMPLLQTEAVIGGTEVIAEIFEDWSNLCEEGECNEPFFTPEWFTCFVKNFEDEILLLTVRRSKKLLAVLPLVKKTGHLHGVSARKFQAVFNPNTPRFDIIHGSDESERKEIVEALWKEIKKQSNWDFLEARLVKKDSWFNDLLALAERENYGTGIWEMDSAPFIKLPVGVDKEKLIEEFFKGSRKHLRQELNRRLRRLKELGEVEFAITREYSPEMMQRYFELEAKGWKGRARTAVTNDPKVVELHDNFAQEIAAKNQLYVYELKLDGKTIAMSINIMSEKQTVHWKTSYDEEYARYSPGNLLFREFLSDCIRNNSQEIDFLSPATPNKKFWASGEREHVAFYIFQRGIFGSLLCKWKFSVISSLRKYKKNNPKKIALAKFAGVLKVF